MVVREINKNEQMDLLIYTLPVKRKFALIFSWEYSIWKVVGNWNQSSNLVKGDLNNSFVFYQE